jgi:hypothetical protein
VGEKRIERSFDIVSGTKKVHAVLFGPRSLLIKAKASEIKADVVGETAQLTLPEWLRGVVETRSITVR